MRTSSRFIQMSKRGSARPKPDARIGVSDIQRQVADVLPGRRANVSCLTAKCSNQSSQETGQSKMRKRDTDGTESVRKRAECHRQTLHATPAFFSSPRLQTCTPSTAAPDPTKAMINPDRLTNPFRGFSAVRIVVTKDRPKST